jgi:hypothetical protein
MVSTKRIAQLANKWQRIAALGRKRLSWAMPMEAPVVDKGHCTVYTVDGRRFQVPLEYLSTSVFAELLLMSQDEGPKRRPEGGEWEPIKIPHRNLAYVPKSTRSRSSNPIKTV